MFFFYIVVVEPSDLEEWNKKIKTSVHSLQVFRWLIFERYQVVKTVVSLDFRHFVRPDLVINKSSDRKGARRVFPRLGNV